MIVALVIVVVVAVAAVGYAWRRPSNASGAGQRAGDLGATEVPRRVLFPYGAGGPTPNALDVALRLARAETGTLVPVFLARVSLDLPLDAPLPRTAQLVIPLQEAIEQRAIGYGVPVDQRIERGRSYRHALREMVSHERFDRIVVAASGRSGNGGFEAEDVAWLLRNAPGEIVVLRPASSPRDGEVKHSDT